MFAALSVLNFFLSHNIAKSSKFLMIKFELKACTQLESKDITELFFFLFT